MALRTTAVRNTGLARAAMGAAAGSLAELARASAVLLCILAALLAARRAVPAYIVAQDVELSNSAGRHGIPTTWLAAVLYNEMLGTESQVLAALVPGDGPAPRAARETLLGLHFLTLKQAQWHAKALAALLGADATIGPAGIRVSVGREIRAEERVVGGIYSPASLLERPSMVADLMAPATAIEYLAANLERGQDRLAAADRGDWEASARWHNTGVVYDSAIVKPRDWDKGTRYIGRVRACLLQVAALLGAQEAGRVVGSAPAPRPAAAAGIALAPGATGAP